MRIFLTFLSYALRLTWPVVLWLIGRTLVHNEMLGSPYYGAAVTGVGLMFWPLCAVLAAGGRGLQLSALLAGLVAFSSGLIGLYWEIERWLSFGNSGPVGVLTALSNLDYPLVVVSALCLMPPFFVTIRRFIPSKISQVHGASRLMSLAEAQRRYNRGALVLGEAYDYRTQSSAGRAPLLRIPAEGHLLTFAGSRSGKTVSVVVPNCLSWDGPLVVHDPKDEISQLTAHAREQKFGREQFLLRPGQPGSGSLNVLEWIDPSDPNAIADVVSLVSWLSGNSEKKSGDNYFENSSLNLVGALIADVLFDPNLEARARNLLTVRERLTSDSDTLLEHLMEIANRGRGYAQGYPYQVAVEVLTLIEGNALAQWNGILGGARTLTGFLATRSLAEMISGVGGERAPLRDLAAGNYDVYICIPGEWMVGRDSTVATALRLTVGALMNTVYRENSRRRAQGQAVNRVLFLLDEMGLMRYMPQLEIARDWGAGGGVTMWGILQGVEQLSSHYGDGGKDLWLANAWVKSFFGVNDLKTAKLLEETIGSETVEVDSTSVSGGNFVGPGHVFGQRSRSRSLAGKPVMRVEEIMRLATDTRGVPDEQLIFIQQQRPLRCGMVKWYRRSEFKALVERGMP